jgi:hypothetical protein
MCSASPEVPHRLQQRDLLLPTIYKKTRANNGLAAAVDRRAPESTRYGRIDKTNHGVGVIWASVQLAKEHMACIYMFRMTANDFRLQLGWQVELDGVHVLAGFRQLFQTNNKSVSLHQCVALVFILVSIINLS